ncbi:hypothetical protein BAUCODRAFT_180392 [Baudoinia panamericana UAMH 10762]|uniref:Heterokaryon incompatibility domain-containing protein n=1 Tax=Baudoinia panamericana (strain UAMH 10762) TaxID=717646 RepID=M2NMF5_BAUPA|nr:uncharacterized protein BAUCODRAFT_180392 [Baudoinia panamericana UAMH 10762]EMD00700.1 hypothetical protein BAUCODRAFT_180392 [Baudoinia panamericana UAMH 10762]
MEDWSDCPSFAEGKDEPGTPASADGQDNDTENNCLPFANGLDELRQSPVHNRLPLQPGNIRLLTIQPGKADTKIRCTLAVYPLDAHLKYSALSYAWGSRLANRGIILNGLTFAIPKNLWRFLRCRRAANTKRSELLWIDAVCINQADSAERTQQVGMMAQIYGSASGVLAWLGPSHHNSDVAMRAIGKGLQYSLTNTRFCDLAHSPTGSRHPQLV